MRDYYEKFGYSSLEGKRERVEKAKTNYTKLAGIITSGIVLLVLMIVGLVAIVGFVSRWQTRADAANRVRVSNIEIRNQKQRVLIAKQQAEIRKQNAVGIREAQDEISKTLTPLYVQFEMTEALKAIAESGSNNSVVFIPSGASGIPLVSGATGPRVTKP